MRAQHVAVAGPSGGGKTTYLREMHARYGGPSVFLTTKSNERKARSSPPRRIRKSSAAYPADIERTREWARARDETVQVIVDESQNAPFASGDDGPVRTGLHEDRSAGVMWVVATQNPQDWHSSQFNYGPIQQTEYWIFVGPCKDWHRGFFDGNGLGDVIPLLPTDRFEWVVIQPKASLEGDDKIVERGTTNERFG